MPTENQSSNTEMVSFPRELSDDLAELIAARARVCGGGAFEIWEEICNGFGKPADQHQGEPVAYADPRSFENLKSFGRLGGIYLHEWMWAEPEPGMVPLYTRPAQGEPVALPVRKDPTERWAVPGGVHKAEGWNACLDEIAKLGPLYPRPVQGEPVAWRGINELAEIVTEWIDGSPPDRMVDLCGNPESFAKIELAYTHADPGEVERLLRKAANADLALSAQTRQVHSLRAKLAVAQEQLRTQDDLLSEAYQRDIGTPLKRKIRANHDALFASAEPNAPTWFCQACQLEQPTDRPCDACGGQTALISAKS